MNDNEKQERINFILNETGGEGVINVLNRVETALDKNTAAVDTLYQEYEKLRKKQEDSKAEAERLANALKKQSESAEQTSNVYKTLSLQLNKFGEATGYIVTTMSTERNEHNELVRVIDKEIISDKDLVAAKLLSIDTRNKTSEAIKKEIEQLRAKVKASGDEKSATAKIIAQADTLGTTMLKTGVTAEESIKKTTNVNPFNILGAKIVEISQRLNNFRWAIVNIGFAAASVLGPIIALTKAGVEFGLEIQRASIIAEVGTKKVMNSMHELSSGTIYDIREMTKAYTEFVKLGFSGQQSLEAMRSISDLATAGFTDLTTASTITGQVLHQFNMQTSEAEHVVNLLAAGANLSAAEVESFGQALSYVGSTAELAGLSLDEVASSITILTNAGFSGQRAGTSLAAMLTQLSKPTDEVKRLFKEIGVEIFDASGNMKDLTSIVVELSNALSGYTQESQLKVLMEAFGARAGRGAFTLISQYRLTGETIADTTEKLRDFKSAHDIAMEVATSEVGTLTSEWNKFKNYLAESSVELAKFAGGTLRLQNAFKRAGVLPDFKEFMNPVEMFGKDAEIRKFGKFISSVFKDGIKEATTNLYYPELATPDNSGLLNLRQQLFGNLQDSMEDSGESLTLLTDAQRRFNETLDTYNLSEYEKALYDINKEYEYYLDNLEKLSPYQRQQLEIWKATSVAILEHEMALKEVEDAFSLLKKEYSGAISSVNSRIKEIGANLKKVKDNMKDILDAKFPGQRTAEDQLHVQELAIKRQELLVLRLQASIEDVSETLRNEAEEYKAWVETIQTYVREQLKAGQDLGISTTQAVREWQTKLLGITITGRDAGAGAKSPEEQKLDEMKKAYQIDKLEYEILYNEKEYQLQKYYDTLMGVTDYENATLNERRNLLQKNAEQLRDLSAEEEYWSSKLEIVSGELDELNEKQLLATGIIDVTMPSIIDDYEGWKKAISEVSSEMDILIEKLQRAQRYQRGSRATAGVDPWLENLATNKETPAKVTSLPVSSIYNESPWRPNVSIGDINVSTNTTTDSPNLLGMSIATNLTEMILKEIKS